MYIMCAILFRKKIFVNCEKKKKKVPKEVLHINIFLDICLGVSLCCAGMNRLLVGPQNEGRMHL